MDGGRGSRDWRGTTRPGQGSRALRDGAVLNSGGSEGGRSAQLHPPPPPPRGVGEDTASKGSRTSRAHTTELGRGRGRKRYGCHPGCLSPPPLSRPRAASSMLRVTLCLEPPSSVWIESCLQGQAPIFTSRCPW